MRDRPSKYVSRPLPKDTSDLPRGSPAKSHRSRPPAPKPSFARLEPEGIVKLGSICGTFLALHLDMIRLSGMRWVRRREGWVIFDRAMRVSLGLPSRQAYSKAVKRLRDLGWIETRSEPGSRLECRLNPNWAKPKAKVINLAAAKQARGEEVRKEASRAELWWSTICKGAEP